MKMHLICWQPCCQCPNCPTMADAKQGKTPEDFYNGSSQSRVVLAKPRLGGFGSSSFGSGSSQSCNPFGSVLRPPQLKPNANPFLKANDKLEDANSEKDKETPSTSDNRLAENKETEAPKFVPLGSANVTPRTATVPAPAQPTAAASSSGFVFGQNLSERVVMKEAMNNGDAASTEHSSSNGTTELLFTNAAASVKESEESGPSESSSGGEGLAAAAAEYERSHARPPPTTSNCTMTGEEGETNVLQISCRLFAWEAGSWRERGRGVLRLNDAEGGISRLVARVSGSLRVILNTKLWPDMVVERAGTKSLRITAADVQHQVKLFLIMGAPSDIAQLNRALLSRVASTKRTVTCKQNASSQIAAERLEAAADDAEYADYADKADCDTGSNEPNPAIDADTHPDNQDMPETTRLESDEQKTDGSSHIDKETVDDKETKALKRKEPSEDDTSPKRQCPEILIE